MASRRTSDRLHVDHLEWMRLVEISGPFLSPPVLSEALPQGMAADDRQVRVHLQQAFEEWYEERTDETTHRAWISYVLSACLGFKDGEVLEGAALPAELSVPMPIHGETIRPDLAIVDTLSQGDQPEARLLIQRLAAGTDLERRPAGSRWAADHLSRMVELLRGTRVDGLRLGLVTNGDRWTLVHAPKGETATYVTWYANLWFQEKDTLRAFREFLGAERAFGDPDRTLERLLERSGQDQGGVSGQLGRQVREAIELLVKAIDDADRSRGGALLEGVTDEALYESAVTVMMRLVFVFYAEDRGLLPVAGSALYRDRYALSTLTDLLQEEERRASGTLERRAGAWSRMLATFRAIHGGVHHQDLSLVPHGGNLFDPDRFPFLEGRAPGSSWRDAESDPLPITDRMASLLLEALQFLEVPVGRGRVETRRLSYRELGVEEIGHVYESLLDHTVVRADEPVLSLKGRSGDEPEVPLSTLQGYGAGDPKLLRYLRDETGRTQKAIENDLADEYEVEDRDAWMVVCDNDERLWGEIEPYAGLVREDRTRRPVVIRSGSAYVTAGSDRRSTGAHYTPRSLSEPVVATTLEPQVFLGPREGRPREKWTLRSPREILDLKVCDPACGSGAFLVQSCRYLAARLVESWDALEAAFPDRVLVSPEGDLSQGRPEERPIPREEEERLAVAKRAVAERCLYGVDRNHLAVEMAKLALWLETLQEKRPFQFLDHAIKCGDTLVGLSRDHIASFHWDPKRTATLEFFAEKLRVGLEASLGWRDRLQGFDEWDLEGKKGAWREAEAALDDARLVGDLAVAAFFGAQKPKARQELRDEYLRMVDEWLNGDRDRADLEEVVRSLRSGAHPVHPLHWEVEFPEVFRRERPGFDAFVGNPPFAGKNTIGSGNRDGYIPWLKSLHPGSHGNADLVAHMFRRSFDQLREGGAFGLIATNTIAQGDTRESGLRWICENGGEIYDARRRVKWPGLAAVVVSVIHVHRGPWAGERLLDGKEVPTVTAFLFHGGGHEDPVRLTANAGKSFQGSIVLGMGFTFDDTDKKGVASSLAERERLIASNPKNGEVIFPYIGGAEVNGSPTHAHHRYVINFGEREEAECRRVWPDLMAIVEEKVKPERAKLTKNAIGRKRAKFWWHYGSTAKQLYAAIAGLERVLVISSVTPRPAFAFLPARTVFSHALIVFPVTTHAAFAALQSRPHELWARFFGSSLEDRLRYTPSDCFETFPFPEDWQTHPALEAAGQAYYDYRAELMVETDLGLTKTYNRFHDPDEDDPKIVRLRELHTAMDRAVLDAYGWTDISTDCGFFPEHEGDESSKMRYRWPDEVRDEVLARLLELNAERAAEEQERCISTRGPRAGASGRSTNGAPKLFES